MPPTRNNEVSIIIPAYNVRLFIEECLDSVVNQSNLLDYRYEIIVGVDGCSDTKDKLIEIKDNYEFLKVFWFPKNVGAYVVRNTLAYKAVYNNIVFFDADDVMYDDLVKTVVKCLTTHHITRFIYYNFGEGSWAGRYAKIPASGVFGIKTTAFKNVGGFMKFRVASDDEFRERSSIMGFTTFNILNKSLFLRRRHKKSLTGNPETRQGSDYREKVRNELRKLRSSSKINPTFGECYPL